MSSLITRFLKVHGKETAATLGVAAISLGGWRLLNPPRREMPPEEVKANLNKLMREHPQFKAYMVGALAYHKSQQEKAASGEDEE